MKKLFNFCTIAGLCLPLCGAYDVEPLTYDSELWSSTPGAFAKSFPDLDWQLSGSSATTSKEGLALWQKDIESVTLSMGPDNTNEHLLFTILGQATASKTEAQQFTLAATQWKQALDKQLGAVGKRVPSIKEGGKTTSKVAWKTDHAIVILSATRGETPEGLHLSIRETTSGMASLNKTIDSAKKAQEEMKEKMAEEKANKPEPEPKSDGKNVVLASLEGKTSYLSGSTFKKKDVSGSPDYFLLYFSASW